MTRHFCLACMERQKKESLRKTLSRYDGIYPRFQKACPKFKAKYGDVTLIKTVVGR